MKRGNSERIVKTRILKARDESRGSLLERRSTRTSGSKLTFNITYYPAFQNVRSIFEKLQLLLVPEKEHKVFPEVSIIYSEMVKALKPC